MWGITLIGSGSDDKRHSRALLHHLGGGRPVWLRHLPLAKHGYELAVYALRGTSPPSARVSRTDGPLTHRVQSRIVPGPRVSRLRQKRSVMEQDHHEDLGGVPRGATSGGGARRRDSADPGRRKLDELFERGRGRATRTRGRAPTAAGRHCRRSATLSRRRLRHGRRHRHRGRWARWRAPQRSRHWRICSACSR